MGHIEEVRLPDIGPTDGVTVVEVLVESGQEVEVDQALLTLESDKASMEVPSPFRGKLVELKVQVVRQRVVDPTQGRNDTSRLGRGFDVGHGAILRAVRALNRDFPDGSSQPPKTVA